MIAVVIPAKDEAARIAETVAAAATLGRVVVVDDGSRDDTATVAAAAGATVVRHPRNRGKAAAMETGAAAVPEADLLLFLDADLRSTAAAAAPLVAAVQRGEADCAIAVLPAVAGAGGRGFVVGLARSGIERATGWAPRQPLSGQRCLTRKAFEAVLPLAPGFGVETAMTIDLLHAGFRVVELETEIAHRVTGTGWRDQLHRARQYVHVRRALRGRRQ